MLNKISEFIHPKPVRDLDYSFLIYKLAKLHDASEYDVFQKSGEHVTQHMIENAFKNYICDGTIPWWVKQHLDENLEQINKFSLPYGVLCLYT